MKEFLSDKLLSLKIHFLFFIQNIKLGYQQMIMYRANYLLVIIMELLNIFIVIFFIEVVYGHITSLCSWSKYEIFILYGTFALQMQIFLGLCIGGVSLFSNNIKSGDFDTVLIKPINSRFISLFKEINIQQVFSLFVSIFMITYGYSNLNVNITYLNMFLYVLFIFIGINIMINLFSIIITFAFFLADVSNTINLAFQLIELSKQPRSIFFNTYIRNILTFIIPITLISNPAVRSLIKNLDFGYLVLTVIIGLFLYVLAEILWSLGLRKYESASS